ncbi:MAG TPA: site-specific integrase [Fulvivirga sp.]|nr:site-specific integrase [Fulvivirga sp.]
MKKESRRKVTTSLVFRKDQTDSNGDYAIKLRIGFDRKSRYYSATIDGKTVYSSNEKILLSDVNLKGENRFIQSKLQVLKGKALTVIEAIESKNKPFTFVEFEANFLKSDSRKSIQDYMDDVYEHRMSDGRIGTAKSYNNAFNAFKKYKKGKPIAPHELTVNELKKFEKYLFDSGVGKTTVGIYMRSLRVAFNDAVDDNPELEALTPFAKRSNQSRKYIIKTGSGHKGDALSPDDLKRFLNLKVEKGTSEFESKLYWMFCFFCQGMNFRDLAYLRYSNLNIKNNSIEYIRRKTKNSEQKESIINVPLTTEILKIINELGNDKQEGLIFDIITDDMSEERQDSVIRQKIKIVNKWLKRLCEANNLPSMTTYWSRHTYASLLKMAEVPVEMIRELLDHSDIRTTENYLKKFDLSEKRKANEKAALLYKSAS